MECSDNWKFPTLNPRCRSKFQTSIEYSTGYHRGLWKRANERLQHRGMYRNEDDRRYLCPLSNWKIRLQLNILFQFPSPPPSSPIPSFPFPHVLLVLTPDTISILKKTVLSHLRNHRHNWLFLNFQLINCWFHNILFKWAKISSSGSGILLTLRLQFLSIQGKGPNSKLTPVNRLPNILRRLYDPSRCSFWCGNHKHLQRMSKKQKKQWK